MKDKLIAIIGDQISPTAAGIKAELIIETYNQYIIEKALEYQRNKEGEKSNAVASLIIETN